MALSNDGEESAMGMVSEAEARTRWCPAARQSTDTINTFNRYDSGEGAQSCLCLGSGCMAWRSAGQHTTIREDVDPPQATIVTLGYCGLAGMPA